MDESRIVRMEGSRERREERSREECRIVVPSFNSWVSNGVLITYLGLIRVRQKGLQKLLHRRRRVTRLLLPGTQ